MLLKRFIFYVSVTHLSIFFIYTQMQIYYGLIIYHVIYIYIIVTNTYWLLYVYQPVLFNDLLVFIPNVVRLMLSIVSVHTFFKAFNRYPVGVIKNNTN